VRVSDTTVEFFSGAVATTYLLAAGFFLRFWRRTRDPLFRSFAGGFLLLALNQIIVSMLGNTDERTGYAYVLRVVGFVLILYAIIRKNVRPGK
jgi:hypothetical protein